MNNKSVGTTIVPIIWRKAMEGKVAPLGSSPTFSDSSSYVGLTLTNKQSVDSHIERNLWVIEQMGARGEVASHC